MRQITNLMMLLGLLAGLAGICRAEDLFEAATRNDATAIEKLLRAGANPNVTNRSGSFPLHLAVTNGNTAAVKALMASGADPKRRDANGFSAFFLASVVRRDLGLTAILMKTNDNSSQATPFLQTSFGSRPVVKPFTDPASLIQWNPRFGYRFNASPDWKMQGVQQDGMFQKQSIVVMTLPAIWSDRERQEIENAIACYTKEAEDVSSLTNAVDAFWRATQAEGEVSNRKEVTANDARYVVDFDQKDRGLVYRKRSHVVFRNGISYRFNFIATPGTFDKNLAVFTAFCDRIQFLKPER